MLRLATPDRLRFGQTGSYIATFGGGEANVAVSLAHYGMQVEYMSTLRTLFLAENAWGSTFSKRVR